MENKPQFDFSMFKRKDGKYEFKGQVFNNSKEIEKYFDEILEMTKKVGSPKLKSMIKNIEDNI